MSLIKWGIPMANQNILSFMCVNPSEDGRFSATFRFLTDGTRGSVVELSSTQLEKRISEYKGHEGLMTNFDNLPQIIEFQKALRELNRAEA